MALGSSLASYSMRIGFGIIVVTSSGDVLAHGHGVPPEWVGDAAGAEAWARLFDGRCRSCHLAIEALGAGVGNDDTSV